MSGLRGIRIQRKPTIQPTPLLQSSSGRSSEASDEEELWNKGFSATNYQSQKTEEPPQSVRSNNASGAKPRMGPKSRTMGPKSKTTGAQDSGFEDELQLALALSMDPKQQTNKEQEQIMSACSNSLNETPKQKSNPINTQSKKQNGITEKSTRPFTNRKFDNWLNDDISSDDEQSKGQKLNQPKLVSQTHKPAAKKILSSKGKKKDASSSSDASSEDEEISDLGKANIQKLERQALPNKSNPNGENSKTKRKLSTSTDDEDEMISKYPRNSNPKTTSQAQSYTSTNKKTTASKKKVNNSGKRHKNAKSRRTKGSSTEEEDSNSEAEEPSAISSSNPILSNKEFQPAPKRTYSTRRNPSTDGSDASNDAEYQPSQEDSRRYSRQTKSRKEEVPKELFIEPPKSRPVRGSKQPQTQTKHPIPNDQMLEYVGSERLIRYITCIAKQVVDSSRMRLFLDTYQNKNLEIDASHPLYEMAPEHFLKDDGEILNKLEELLEKPLEAGKAIISEDGNYPFEDDCKQKFLRFVLIPECIIHYLKKKLSMEDQEAEEFYQQIRVE